MQSGVVEPIMPSDRPAATRLEFAENRPSACYIRRLLSASNTTGVEFISPQFGEPEWDTLSTSSTPRRHHKSGK